MNTWLTVRTFLALFLFIFGIGIVFIRTEDMRILVGAALAAIGLTFMVRIAIVLRQS